MAIKEILSNFKDIKKQCDLISKELMEKDFDALGREEQLGREFSFEQESKLLKEVVSDLFIILKSTDESFFSQDGLGEIRSYLSNIQNVISEIELFDIKKDGASSNHNNISTQVWNIINGKKDFILSLKNRLSNSNKLNVFLETLKDIQDKQTKLNLGQKEVEIETVKDSITEAQGNFDKERGKYENRSKLCLIILGVTIVSSLVIFGILWYHSIEIFGELELKKDSINIISYFRVAQLIIVKFLIIGFYWFVCNEIFKLYKINTHLASLYSHRILCLSTFKPMYFVVDTDDTKIEVVRNAANAIFVMPDTGFLGIKDKTKDTTKTILTNVIDKAVSSIPKM